ncbi:cytochrome c oxidase assembly protein [Microbacterium rhizomatis]|uniref:Cytochrome c oxidase assembly protein n=1 Tax=Microbacterium rhizomatis TaxID=1631477 RepID=A0A5J5J324_9MICO|nr:cytochrome c oxidase assembly protein [Microbacterium rhizomatis]KAA9107598.1 cytochrome c oxidase assembly protein [Microbacterium rhizomatis]
MSDPSRVDALLSPWAPSVVGLGLPALAAVAYAVGVAVARGRGIPWAIWRVVIWMVTCALGVWTFAGPAQALRDVNPWMDGVSIGMAAAVLPLGVALGDPVKLIELLRGRRIGWARGRVARFVMFPGVASLVSAVVLTYAITSQWYQASLTEPLPWVLLLLTAFVTGLAVNLPLLSDDLMPEWATPAVKTLVAFADGLFDAVPGLVMMLLINKYSGGALLAIAEVIGIPMIAATVVMWVRADAREQREIDAELDAREAEGQGPWWLDDPRFADRFRD